MTRPDDGTPEQRLRRQIDRWGYGLTGNLAALAGYLTEGRPLVTTVLFTTAVVIHLLGYWWTRPPRAPRRPPARRTRPHGPRPTVDPDRDPYDYPGIPPWA